MLIACVLCFQSTTKKSFCYSKRKWTCSPFSKSLYTEGFAFSLSPLSYTVHHSELMKNYFHLCLIIKQVTWSRARGRCVRLKFYRTPIVFQLQRNLVCKQENKHQKHLFTFLQVKAAMAFVMLKDTLFQPFWNDQSAVLGRFHTVYGLFP